MPTITTVDARSVVEKLESEFVLNVEARDAKRLVAGFYAPDAQFFPNHAPAAVGTAQIVRACQGMFDQGVTGLKLTTSTTDADGATIWSTGSYELTIQPPGTTQEIIDHGKYVTVFRRQSNGDWRCVADCFNSNLPLPGTPSSN